MTKLVVIDRQGSEREIEVANGISVMEAIRDNGFDELLALCGGCCSCATCHVYLTGGWFEKLSPSSDEEIAVLDSAPAVEPNSRLACQIRCVPENDGITLTIAP